MATNQTISGDSRIAPRDGRTRCASEATRVDFRARGAVAGALASFAAACTLGGFRHSPVASAPQGPAAALVESTYRLATDCRSVVTVTMRPVEFLFTGVDLWDVVGCDGPALVATRGQEESALLHGPGASWSPLEAVRLARHCAMLEALAFLWATREEPNRAVGVSAPAWRQVEGTPEEATLMSLVDMGIVPIVMNKREVVHRLAVADQGTSAIACVRLSSEAGAPMLFECATGASDDDRPWGVCAAMATGW